MKKVPFAKNLLIRGPLIKGPLAKGPLIMSLLQGPFFLQISLHVMIPYFLEILPILRKKPLLDQTLILGSPRIVGPSSLKHLYFPMKMPWFKFLQYIILIIIKILYSRRQKTPNRRVPLHHRNPAIFPQVPKCPIILFT